MVFSSLIISSSLIQVILISQKEKDTQAESRMKPPEEEYVGKKMMDDEDVAGWWPLLWYPMCVGEARVVLMTRLIDVKSFHSYVLWKLLFIWIIVKVSALLRFIVWTGNKMT